MHPLLDNLIPLLGGLTILTYAFRRFLGTMRIHRKMMRETTEFTSMVRRARESLEYLNEEASRGMEEIADDVGRELKITDRLTRLGSKVDLAVRRFAELEEEAIELARLDRGRESVTIGTPADVPGEIGRAVAAAAAAATRTATGAADVERSPPTGRARTSRLRRGGGSGIPRRSPSTIEGPAESGGIGEAREEANRGGSVASSLLLSRNLAR